MNPRPIIKILTQQSSVKINNKKKNVKKQFMTQFLSFFPLCMGHKINIKGINETVS